MMSPGGKQTALSYHPTNRVNTAQEMTYLSINIDFTDEAAIAFNS